MVGELFSKALPLILLRLKNVEIDHAHHIPYLGGQSKNRDRVYIDSRTPLHLHIGSGVYDLHKYLAYHEVVEKAIEDLLHTSYNDAHKEAEKAETQLILDDGLDPVPYHQYISKTYPWTLEHFEPEKVPKDLDLRPYIEDGKRKVIEAVSSAA